MYVAVLRREGGKLLKTSRKTNSQLLPHLVFVRLLMLLPKAWRPRSLNLRMG